MNRLLEHALSLLLVMGIGFGIYHTFLKSQAEPVAQVQPELESYPTDAFFNTELQRTPGSLEALKNYQGKTIVVNFWATWCPPCREEMPDLSTLHEQYQDQNVVVLGLAIDALEPVKEFQNETPVSYPLYIAEDEGMVLSAHLGNKKGVLPYTAIIDTKGHVLHTFYGKVNQKILQTALVNTQ